MGVFYRLISSSLPKTHRRRRRSRDPPKDSEMIYQRPKISYGLWTPSMEVRISTMVYIISQSLSVSVINKSPSWVECCPYLPLFLFHTCQCTVLCAACPLFFLFKNTPKEELLSKKRGCKVRECVHNFGKEKMRTWERVSLFVLCTTNRPIFRRKE